MRLVFLSDIHFGRIASPRIVSALVDDIRSHNPDLVVVGGDLTQRSRKTELRAAARLLADIKANIVIPGNHDVFAWWFPIRRLVAPLDRYRRMVPYPIEAELVTDEAAILALNSSFGWTVKGGRFTRGQINRARTFFSSAGTRLKILVVHHHLSDLRDVFGKHDIAIGGRRLFATVLETGVDLILSGHLHQSHSQIVGVGRKTAVLVSSGTATSDRGRRADLNRNIYELVSFSPFRIEILERVFSVRSEVFEDGRVFSFVQRDDVWFDEERPGE